MYILHLHYYYFPISLEFPAITGLDNTVAHLSFYAAEVLPSVYFSTGSWERRETVLSLLYEAGMVSKISNPVFKNEEL